jgi:hypothetical protein
LWTSDANSLPIQVVTNRATGAFIFAELVAAIAVTKNWAIKALPSGNVVIILAVFAGGGDIASHKEHALAIGQVVIVITLTAGNIFIIADTAIDIRELASSTDCV